MRTIFGLCGLILIAGAVFLYRSTRMPDRFGQFTGGEKVEVAELVHHPKRYLHKPLSIEGDVREQCTSMGCYFFFHSGDKALRVDIQEVAMTAPQKDGHHARVEGQVEPYGDGYEFSASAVEFE